MSKTNDAKVDVHCEDPFCGVECYDIDGNEYNGDLCRNDKMQELEDTLEYLKSLVLLSSKEIIKACSSSLPSSSGCSLCSNQEECEIKKLVNIVKEME